MVGIFDREGYDDGRGGRSEGKRLCDVASGNYGVRLDDLEVGIEIRVVGGVEHSCFGAK